MTIVFAASWLGKLLILPAYSNFYWFWPENLFKKNALIASSLIKVLQLGFTVYVFGIVNTQISYSLFKSLKILPLIMTIHDQTNPVGHYSSKIYCTCHVQDEGTYDAAYDTSEAKYSST